MTTSQLRAELAERVEDLRIARKHADLTPSAHAERWAFKCYEAERAARAALTAAEPKLYDLPIFAWAWREDARDVERA